jgi:DNA polymerase-3 subunit delta
MKLYSNKADGFIKSPKGAAVLIYGPDTGAGRVVAKQIAKAFLPNVDSMSVTELSGDQIKADPAILADEYYATSFFVEKKALLIDDPENGFLEQITEILQRPNPNNIIIITAGELSRESKLRKFFEDSKELMTILCYKDDAMSLRNYIVSAFREAGVFVDKDAMDYLVANLGEDKQVTKNEVEKILIYLGTQKKLTFEDVQAILADNSEITVGDIAFAVATKDAQKLEKTLTRAFGENINAVPILRSVQYQFQRMINVKDSLSKGVPLDSALQSLRPQVFFKQADLFKLALRKWSEEQIKVALQKVTDAELAAKGSTLDADMVCRQELLKLVA